MRKPVATMEAMVSLVSIAETHDWVKAAEQLGVTVSALQKRVKLLSDLLGTRLVYLSGNSVLLNEAGQLYYREAAQAIQHSVLGEEKTRTHILLRANHLLVGHSTHLSPRLLSMIQQLALPGPTTVTIAHRTGLTPDIIERVADGTLHLGFGYLPVMRESLLVRQLLEEPLVVCIPGDWSLALKAEIHPRDLDDMPVIAVARDVLPAFHEEIEEYFHGFEVFVRIVADAFSPLEALTYVEHKIGICIRGLWNNWTESPLKRFGLSDRVAVGGLLLQRCPA